MNVTFVVLTANATNITVAATEEVLQENPDPRPYLTAEEYDQLFDMYYYVCGIAQISICCVGAITNLLNIIALSKSLKQATYRILLGMAVADFMIMILLGSTSISIWLPQPTILTRVRYGPPHLQVPYSQYFWYYTWFHAVNIFWMASSWCAVILAIFRLIVISAPLKAPVLASNKRITIALIAVYLGSLAVQAFNWQQFEIDEHGTFLVVTERSQIALVQIVIAQPIPFLICLVCTTLLAVQLSNSRKKMQGAIRQEQLKERTKEQQQLTLTLVLIVTLYVLSNSPTIVYFIIDQTNSFYMLNISRFDQNTFYLIGGICSVTGYASNFFIYILANPTFRKDLLRVFGKKIPYKPHSYGTSVVGKTQMSSIRSESSGAN